MKNLKAMNLQMYADPAPAPAPTPAPSPTPAPNPTLTPAPVEIDYDKLAQLISGKQAATEDRQPAERILQTAGTQPGRDGAGNRCF